MPPLHGTPKSRGHGLLFKTRFWPAGRYTLFGKGLRATRASTLSPDLGSSSITALVSDLKIAIKAGF